MTDDFLILNDGFWPTVRIHPPRRKAAVDYSNVAYVERPGNWCSRPQTAARRTMKPAIGTAALLWNLTHKRRAEFGHSARSLGPRRPFVVCAVDQNGGSCPLNGSRSH